MKFVSVDAAISPQGTVMVPVHSLGYKHLPPNPYTSIAGTVADLGVSANSLDALRANHWPTTEPFLKVPL